MKFFKCLAVLLLMTCGTAFSQELKLNDSGYFENGGVNVIAFQDIYPEGHQGGVCLIMNGNRIATGGDLRLEATPGQWQPTPKQLNRVVGENSVTTYLAYPDSSRHETGFNPMLYPDLQIRYSVRVEEHPEGVLVTLDLENPIPERYLGKVGLNFEFFPGSLFGKPWIMDNQAGLYPQQPNSPLLYEKSNTENLSNYHTAGRSRVDPDHFMGKEGVYNPIVADDIIALPYAVGREFTSRPDDALNRVTVKCLTEGSELKLYDGRMNHNNGWFVLRSEVPAGATKAAVQWLISPTVTPEWIYKPVVQTSQVGYACGQEKKAVIELDVRDLEFADAQLFRIGASGHELVKEIVPNNWGKFLRYNYLQVDFSDIEDEGLYQIKYKESMSPIFRISDDVYSRGVWQPVIEYFLPVQMCHMRVNEKYRVWHDACHMDDGAMAPAFNHIDGYDQKDGLSKYEAHEFIEGVNIGGWHDAGDFDLRIESQSGECYILSMAYETFKPELDVTAIDQQARVCEIHQADGRNDILQQIENGALSVVNGYLALGRLYRGIICRDLRQYVLLGDAAAMTDGIKGNGDDRWVFTEDNPRREIATAANLAATYRVLKSFNDTLAVHCLNIAEEIFANVSVQDKSHAATELYLATRKDVYKNYLIDNETFLNNAERNGWYLARVAREFEGLKDKKAVRWARKFREAVEVLPERIEKALAQTPYGVPYSPDIWGEGWDIQGFGFRHYFLAEAYPEIFDMKPVLNSLNFVLGCHPGLNQASYASGVGAESATVGYGLNRADWSYIPGGVISGTGLIRPDFPELLTFPFLWQQTEYVLGGGSSHYFFLALAAESLAK